MNHHHNHAAQKEAGAVESWGNYLLIKPHSSSEKLYSQGRPFIGLFAG